MCRSLIFLEGVLFGRLRRQIACSILGPEVMGSASLALDDMAFWVALLRDLQLCVGCLALEVEALPGEWCVYGASLGFGGPPDRNPL
jgi:hypothetical protein